MIRVNEGLLPMSEFKARTAQYVERLQNGSGPLVITQHGRAAMVVLHPAEYDELMYERYVNTSINAGLRDMEEGNTISMEELRQSIEHDRQTERRVE